MCLQYKIECRVTIELLDNETEDATATAVNSAKEWENYVERLSNPAAGSQGQGASATVTTAASNNANNALTAVSNLNRTANKNFVSNRTNSYNGNNLNINETNLEIKTEKSDDDSVSETKMM